MKIGVISDTHIPFRARFVPPVVFELFAGVELILHAGDLVSESVIEELGAVAPVSAVCGNCDPYELRRKYPRTRLLEFNGWKIGLVHGDGPGRNTPERALHTFAGVDCVVFGHSHRPYNQRVNGTLLFNPGSPTDKRGLPQFSVGVLALGSDGLFGTIHYF